MPRSCPVAAKIAAIADAVGTPVYVYSTATFERHARVFREGLAPAGDVHLAYAIKANPNLAVLRVLAREGYGADVVSGGELARIALAISVITSHATTTPTLIFDEVDSGIGGGVAEVVGRLLKRLGQERQVLCVTHLPQVASQANQHFQVAKGTTDAGKTVSRIDVLDNKARVEEVARMLGGLEITATTRKHARELLAL